MKLPFFLARRFVASETVDGTLPVARSLSAEGLHVTLDLLGEYISDRSLASAALESYIELIQLIEASNRASMEESNGSTGSTVTIDHNISIKLSMIGLKIDESFCYDNLVRLLDVAKKYDTFIRLDMEGTDVTESTLSIFERVFPMYPDHVGIVLQAYLRRTAEDVDRMCQLNARVRICKGAYSEPDSLAFQKMSDIRERYLEYMQMLITQGKYPGIATHDDILIRETKAFVRSQNIAAENFEFQMLYGIRSKTQLAITAEGYNMRIYIPFGRMWVPYFSRRLRERKENVFFVLKNLIRR